MTRRRALALWLTVGWAGFALLPWSAVAGGGFFAFQWIAAWPRDARVAPAAVALLLHGRLWFVPLAVALVVPLAALSPRVREAVASRILTDHSLHHAGGEAGEGLEQKRQALERRRYSRRDESRLSPPARGPAAAP